MQKQMREINVGGQITSKAGKQAGTCLRAQSKSGYFTAATQRACLTACLDSGQF